MRLTDLVRTLQARKLRNGSKLQAGKNIESINIISRLKFNGPSYIPHKSYVCRLQGSYRSKRLKFYTSNQMPRLEEKGA